jgi:hypothetical protein
MPNKNHALVALFALTAIGIGSLCISVFANEQQQQRTIMNDPRRDMITTLEARGPHPSIWRSGADLRPIRRHLGL